MYTILKLEETVDNQVLLEKNQLFCTENQILWIQI